MRKILLISIILFFSFSAFAQIDTSAWEGKTVLVIVNQYANFNDGKKMFRDNWYLTDSVDFQLDTLVKRNLNSFGEDTVIIKWGFEWQRSWYVGGYDCYTEDCMNWIFVESIEFRDFHKKKWDKYLNIFPVKHVENSILKFQRLITLGTTDSYYKDKNIIVQNYKWDLKMIEFVNERFKDFQIVKYRIGNEKYMNIDFERSIYIYKQLHPKFNYIEIIDLKTNRVIEKIELEP